MNFLFIPVKSLASRLLWFERKISFVQAETFETKPLHFNVDRRLFLINSVSTKIATSSGRKEFHKAVLAKLERPI